MKIYQQNRNINFILKLKFVRQKLFGQPEKLIDLSGYNCKVSLISQKKILVNNTFSALTYDSVEDPSIVMISTDDITINLNCLTLPNSIYSVLLYIYNKNYSFCPYMFQLNLVNSGVETNLILTDSVQISGESYRLIELNSDI